MGSQPGHHRGPGHVPDRDGARRRAARQSRCAASPISVPPSSTSSSRMAPTSTGRASRTLEYLSAACRAFRGRPHRARPGRHRSRAGSTSTPSSIESGTHSLADLRSYQDWYLRYHLKSVRGVADVASVGGYVRQYQVNVDPNRLRAHGLADQPRRRRGARRQQRGRRARRSSSAAPSTWSAAAATRARRDDFENIALRHDGGARRSASRTSARSSLGPDLRRGAADLDGRGEAVSGIVIMRHGENALDVIDAREGEAARGRRRAAGTESRSSRSTTAPS